MILIFRASDAESQKVEVSTLDQKGRFDVRVYRAVSFVLALAALVGLLAAGPKAAWSAKFAPGAETFFLENGMQVVVVPDHRTPVVTHMVWYRVGAADETGGKTGIAHFLEHLLFKGTANHPDGEFSRLVAQNGGQENAFTSMDYTAYYQRIAKQYLPMVMELEADRMANLVLTESDISAEREVVREERRSRVENNPGSQLSEELLATLYRSHPYGRPVIGWDHEISALNRDDALEFYQRFYSPNNAILIVSGDVTVEEMRGLAERFYGPLERRAEFGPRVRPKEPVHRGPRRVTVSSDRVQQPSFRRIYDFPSYSTAPGRDAEALDLLSQILGGGSSSRLYTKLVIEDQIATSASAWYASSGLDAGRFGFYAAPRGETTLDEVEAAAIAIVEDLKENGVTEAELARAKTQLIAEAVYAQDSQAQLARVFGVALTTGSKVEDVQGWPDQVAAVTVEDVHRVARQYLDARKSATGVLLPLDLGSSEEERS